MNAKNVPHRSAQLALCIREENRLPVHRTYRLRSRRYGQFGQVSFFDFGFKSMVLIGLSNSFIPILGRYHNRSLRGGQLLVVTASGASTYHLDLASFSPS